MRRAPLLLVSLLAAASCQREAEVPLADDPVPPSSARPTQPDSVEPQAPGAPPLPTAGPDDDVEGKLPASPEGEGVPIQSPAEPGPLIGKRETSSLDPNTPGDGMPIPSDAPTGPKVMLPKPEVNGALDRDIVHRIVRAHLDELRHCCRTALDDQPDLSGSVTLQFAIGSNGQVASVSVAASDLPSAVSQCMARTVKRWTFPRPSTGLVTVSQPITLEPN